MQGHAVIQALNFISMRPPCDKHDFLVCGGGDWGARGVKLCSSMRLLLFWYVLYQRVFF